MVNETYNGGIKKWKQGFLTSEKVGSSGLCRMNRLKNSKDQKQYPVRQGSDVPTCPFELCKTEISNATKLDGKYRVDFYDLLKRPNINIEDFKSSN